MKEQLLKETLKVYMPFINWVMPIGFWFKPTTTEIIQILYTTPEEFQFKKDWDKEEIPIWNHKICSIHLCLYGQP